MRERSGSSAPWVFGLSGANEKMPVDNNGFWRDSGRSHCPMHQKPVLVIRLSTERPEAVETGFAKVVGTKKHEILAAIGTALMRLKELPGKSPFGDGDAAEKIVEIIGKDFFSAQDM